MPEREAALGIFGGTFDPVHFGHLRLAEEAADALGLAAVRWIPAGQPALRDAPAVSAEQRFEMVRRAIAGNPRFELDGAEVEARETSYTVTTLERLRHPEHCGAQRPLVVIVGADAFAGVNRWHRWESLFALAHLAVAQRPGSPLSLESLPPPLGRAWRERFVADAAELASAPAGRIVTFAMTQLDISATAIRSLLSNGRSARFLLPESVLCYIRDHELYEKE
jgi:nicotinate-nucleotide adenylyltransferase